MYSVLDKDIIKKKLFLIYQLAKRGFQTTVPSEEIVNAVLYKLKTGVQWQQHPCSPKCSNCCAKSPDFVPVPISTKY